MLDHFEELSGFLTASGKPQACAVATIIASDGSVPRPSGTSMLVSESGAVVGSLSGGCIEAAVYEACHAAISSGARQWETFGFSGDDAFAVGLACGGSIEVMIQPFYPPSREMEWIDTSGIDSWFEKSRSQTETRTPAPSAIIRRIDNDALGGILVADALGFDVASIQPELRDMLGNDALVENASTQVAALIRNGQTSQVRLAPPPDGTNQPVVLFVESRRPAPRLFVFGANDFGAALAAAAKLLGYHVTLCDARSAFADPTRFSDADEVVVQWPHDYLAAAARNGLIDQRSAICVLTHDAKFDIPLLLQALRLDAGYIGAMGSRRSDRQRRDALKRQGATPAQLSKLRSPIGMDLGAVTPQEVAVSITSEIVAARHERQRVSPLSHSEDPIHD